MKMASSTWLLFAAPVVVVIVLFLAPTNATECNGPADYVYDPTVDDCRYCSVMGCLNSPEQAQLCRKVGCPKKYWSPKSRTLVPAVIPEFVPHQDGGKGTVAIVISAIVGAIVVLAVSVAVVVLVRSPTARRKTWNFICCIPASITADFGPPGTVRTEEEGLGGRVLRSFGHVGGGNGNDHRPPAPEAV